eukprot:GCRY01006429.1.p1 GENE.GCRY01006429.1~~GCRY01006429.1.p1  ORF type:complete len:282 (-),score=44.33 GCRY01006429.1:739-1500(-)
MAENPTQHWMEDSSAATCSNCDKPFSLLTRRHHCRCCGKVFCGNCTKKSIPVRIWSIETPVRVCDSCYDLEKEHIPRLLEGKIFRKYGRKGTPHLRFIYLDQSITSVCWRPIDATPEERTNSLPLADIINFIAGRAGKNFNTLGSKLGRTAGMGGLDPSTASFSIISRTRTLDLEADSPRERDKWVVGLKLLVDIVAVKEKVAAQKDPKNTPTEEDDDQLRREEYEQMIRQREESKKRQDEIRQKYGRAPLEQ